MKTALLTMVLLVLLHNTSPDSKEALQPSTDKQPVIFVILAISLKLETT